MLAIHDQTNNTYRTVGKVGSGYTDAQLDTFLGKTKNSWVQLGKKSRYPSWIIHPHGAERPDALIRSPELSQLVEITCSEIVPTSLYDMQYTLRFPRLVSFREDKSILECMNVAQFMDLMDSLKRGILHCKRVSSLSYDQLGDNLRRKNNRRNYVSKQMIKPSVPSSLQGASVDETNRISNLFMDLEFCILSCQDKAGIETLVFNFGATFVQNPRRGMTSYVVADNLDIKVKNLIASGWINIVTSKWVYECTRKGKIIPLDPRYVLFATKETREAFLREVCDEYDDVFEAVYNATGLESV